MDESTKELIRKAFPPPKVKWGLMMFIAIAVLLYPGHLKRSLKNLPLTRPSNPIPPYEEISNEYKDKIKIYSFIRSTNRTLNNKESLLLASMIVDYSSTFKLDPRLVASVCAVESRFETDIINSKNCFGMMQIRPRDNEGKDVWLNELINVGIIKKQKELLGAEKNIQSGCYIISTLFLRYDNIYHVLSAYSGLPSGNVEYFKKVMSLNATI